MSGFNDATLRQITAADPQAATWLTANAGSGKTRVLTDRVARLLLDGVDPQNILCLTYTKAAAGEMQNRLFRTLGEWAMLDNDTLTEKLRQKGVADQSNLDQARRLFARAIEAPGGLKIQTIHSFCAGLLRRFPLEAGVSPQFVEMDDRTAELIRLEVLDEMANANAPSLAQFAHIYTGGNIEKIGKELMGKAELFTTPIPTDQIAGLLGAKPDQSAASLLSNTLGNGLWPILQQLHTALLTGGSNDNKAAAIIGQILQNSVLDGATFQLLCNLFLFGEKTKKPFGAKIGSFPTKAVRLAHADLMDDVEHLMEVVQDLREQYLAQNIFDRTRALYDFATEFVPRVQAKVQMRGLLGFDDLIHKARDLLSNPDVAAWVLWRLDGGIDHILVDEAQDTSPEQWAVIQLLAQEFAAGQGARSDQRRTLFVVGDRKQSIYSFQGADPDEFDRMQAHFQARLQDSETPLQTLSLDHSFRSSRAILDLVDRVFVGDAADGLETNVTHLAFKENMPGRVDLWPPVEAVENEEDQTDWTAPVDKVSPLAPHVQLAKKIARQIRHMVDHETIPVEVGHSDTYECRPITEGDILILVRGRQDGLFDAILRECKSAHLQVAGADRLKLGAEMAVRDLLALLNFLSMPDDDLALATALRSPLFGWSEQMLFDLAHSRPKTTLWATLRQRQDHKSHTDILHDLLNKSDFLRPFDLLSRVLTRHQGRVNLLARLGQEAEEGIDALLSQALTYEQAQVPSLTGFLIWLSSEDVEIKRQMDSTSNAIRVMTVHGSKGLEAPIVIMPDTRNKADRDRDAILTRDGCAIWKPTKPGQTASLRDLAEQDKMRETRETRRLLYVGMTRAEKWLIIAAAGNVGDEAAQSWYRMIETAMENSTEFALADGETALRISHGDWDGLPHSPAKTTQTHTVAPPSYPAAPHPDALPGTLSPSELGGAKIVPGDTEEGNAELAKQRGTVLHRLLQYLPDVPAAAQMAVAGRIIGDDPALANLPDLAITLLSNPALAHIFAENSLPEVELTAALPDLGNRRIFGAIDRLVVTNDQILVIDFKSNRVIPPTADQTPEGILRQMGAYVAAVQQIYPGRDVSGAVLWTEAAQLMPLPNALIMAALSRATIP